jgi:nitroimidazol reductase NimA-like FMN-containing flavoprotein (pyridoxamine 5'-phosphate oxidase superfamily)
MPPLSEQETKDFLASAWIGKLGTLLDGWPYINPIWYEWDGQHFWIIGKPFAQFVQNIKQDDRVFLVVDKPEFPYVRVNVQARAEVVSEEWSERWVEMTRAMTVRYVGEQGLAYLEERLKYPLSVIRVTPLKMNTWKVTDFPPDRTFTAEATWHQAAGG